MALDAMAPGSTAATVVVVDDEDAVIRAPAGAACARRHRASA
jgi:hypothetical protein